MGNFYTNYTLRGPSQKSVAEALAGRSAIVTPTQAGCVVVFDEESDEQNWEIIAELGSRLSGQFQCPLLAVLNHDDDILWYQLYLSGELVDEYNSEPGYFESGPGAGPEGGDAKRLCAAFDSSAVAEVQKILKANTDSYTFASERHMDLVGALGIASFGTGTGFETVSIGELPDDLSESELMRTKDVTPGPSLEDVWRRPVPGYYKVSFRANPKLTKSVPAGWMPGTWAEMECPEPEISDEFRQATAVHRERMKQWGFVEQGFKKLKRILVTNVRDRGGVNYLDFSRCHFGQIIYRRSYVPATRTEKENVVISFTAVFPNEVFSCTNHVDFLEPVPGHNVVRLKSDDAGYIHEQFLSHLKQRTDSPRHFPDLQSLQAWFDANAIQIFEYRVRRGAWVRMSDFEVEKFRKTLNAQ